MDRVPTSWYEGEHLLARLRAHNVPQSDPAWCVATGHLWGLYYPDPMPPEVVSWIPKEPDVSFEPMRAHRHCARCDASQDYNTGEIRAALAPTPAP